MSWTGIDCFWQQSYCHCVYQAAIIFRSENSNIANHESSCVRSPNDCNVHAPCINMYFPSLAWISLQNDWVNERVRIIPNSQFPVYKSSTWSLPIANYHHRFNMHRCIEFHHPVWVYRRSCCEQTVFDNSFIIYRWWHKIEWVWKWSIGHLISTQYAVSLIKWNPSKCPNLSKAKTSSSSF